MKALITLLSITLATCVQAQNRSTEMLFKAIKKDNYKKAASALENGADPNGPNHADSPTTSPFLAAVKKNQLKLVKLMLEEYNAQIEQRKPIEQFTGLMIASKYNLKDMVQLLLSYKADVNSQTLLGRSSLHIAALKNSLGAADILLSQPDINVNLRARLCALSVAARQGHEKMVLLMRKHARTKPPSNLCLERARHMAQLNGHEKMLEILGGF